MKTNRVIQVSYINNVIKKNGVDLDDCFDFLIEIEGELDYLLYSKKREEIVQRIVACKKLLTGKNLPVEETSTKLNQYMATQKQDRALSFATKSDAAGDQMVELCLEEVEEVLQDAMHFDKLICDKEEAIERKYGSWMDRSSSSGSPGKRLQKLAEERDKIRESTFTKEKLDQIGEKEFEFLDECESDEEEVKLPVQRRTRNTYIGNEEIEMLKRQNSSVVEE